MSVCNPYTSRRDLNLTILDYAYKGDLDGARRVFNRIRTPDRYSYSNLFKAHISHLKKGDDGAFQALLTLFERLKRQLQPDDYHYNQMLHACDIMMDLESAEKFYNEMREPTDIAHRLMLSIYSKHDKEEEAEKIFALLNEKDSSAFTSMISLFCKVMKPEKVEHYVDLMRNKPTEKMRLFIIGMYTKLNLLAPAENYFTPPFHPDMFSMMTKLYFKNDKPENARRVLNQMKGDASTKYYNLLFSYYAKKEQWKNSNILYRQMLANHVPPNEVTYSIRIKMFIDLNRGHEAEEVFLEAHKRIKITTDSIFTPLFTHYAKINLFSVSVKLLEMMVNRGITPTAYTYHSFIKIIAEKLQENQALELLEMMIENNISPFSSTYLDLIDMYGKLKKFKEAENLLEPNQRNALIYHALIRIHLENNDYDSAMRLYVEMKMTRHQPLRKTIKLMRDSVHLNSRGNTSEAHCDI